MIGEKTTASIRELKSRLSHYLRITKAGGIVEVTERGVPIGRIVPALPSAKERAEALVRTGLVAWNRQSLEPREPLAKVRGKRTVAELLIDDRE